MWIFTDTGFVSAVVDGDNPRQLVVRSRDRLSLESLADVAGDQIIVGAGTDYPYRLLCDRGVFQQWAVARIAAVDYTNFKDRVHDTRGETFADALMSVWSAMVDVTDEEGRSW